jgi:imidazolonepropionase-like amidohydrolase
MKRRTSGWLAVAVGMVLWGVGQANPQEQAGVLVLMRANVIDGVSAEPLRDATVIVREGRIESVRAGAAAIPAGATVLDLGGRWLLPGFVDAHAHLSDLRGARTALASGTTTARSLGGNHFVDVGLRELHRAGWTDLPDVLASGYHVRPRPADAFFLDMPKLHELARGVEGTEKVRQLVRAMVGRGADVIKIAATERAGLPETDPRKRVFTDEELAAAVDEARSAGIPVAAHAHGAEGAAAAVRAGVSTIEHGTWLDPPTLALMQQRSTCLVPTIATVLDLVDPGGDYDDPALSIRGRAMLPVLRAITAQAWQRGVRIIAGTDTGYGPRSNRRMPHEVAELAAVGLPPMEAIRAATSVSAACLGIAGRTGAIRAGLEADLVVVERDPLADLTALQDVLVVVNNGRVVVNRLAR